MEGRLAESDGEHASRLDDARAEPAVRPMTADEQQEWFSRIPAGLRSQREESFTVWTAQVGRGWGVEATTWGTATGTPTSTLLVFCRDDEDALDLCRHLRENHTPHDLSRLQEMAADAVREPAPTEAPGSPVATSGSGRYRAPLALSEEAWEAALRAELPPRLADRIIVKDPAHPHHTAWRELCALANEEVGRVGADPAALARLVRTVPTWSENVRKPPALAQWALTEMRSSPNYEQAIRRPQPTAGPDSTAPSSTTADQPSVVDGEVVPNRLRLDQVSSPQQALRWAEELEATNPQHRLEAKSGVGRWGAGVDAVLARKFPGLMQATNAAAKRQRDRDERGAEQVAVHVPEETPPAEASTDPEQRKLLLKEVERLDPAKSGDRLHAFAMFGHVSSPEVDLALARKFGDDDRFAQKLVAHYPGGLTEIEKAAWRGRADANEQRGAAHMAVPDDPDTPPREDADARATATGDQQAAAAQHAAAAAVSTTPPVLRPTEPSRGRAR
jgi:hypothetical protein